MKTSHGDDIAVLPGIGHNIVIRIVDSEGRLAIARLTLDEADTLLTMAAMATTDQAGRHRGPPIITEG